MTVGVLLTAFGYLENVDDVGTYLTRILGRDPPPEAVAHLRERYEAIGGPGPLRRNTEAQARALQRTLGEGYRVEVGLRYAEPFIPDAAEDLARDPQVEALVVVPLAPQYNTHSVAAYLAQARAGVARLEDPPAVATVERYGTHPDLVAYWAHAVRDARASLPPGAREGPRVVFTAHSLPRTILDEGDPYPDECLATSRAVAEAAGVPDWTLAYQSGQPGWLGPDVADDLEKIAGDATALVVAPVGFVSEHLETLDDLDLEAADAARQLGLPFVRVPAPNDDPRFVACLADVVRRHVP